MQFNKLNTKKFAILLFALILSANTYCLGNNEQIKETDAIRSTLAGIEDKNSDKFYKYRQKLLKFTEQNRIDYSSKARLADVSRLINERKFDIAVFELKQLIEEHYQTSKCYEFLGDICLKIGKPLKRAGHYYNLALNEDKKNYMASFKLAGLYFQENKTTPGITYLSSAVDDCNNTEFLNYMLQYIKNKVNIEDKYEANNIYEILGRIYLKLNRKNDAIEAFKTALKLNPEDIFLKYYLGDLLYCDNDDKNAIVLYDSILNENPEDTAIRTSKAKALASAGNLLEAEKEYKKILRENPRSKQAKYGLYKLYERKENPEKIIEKINGYSQGFVATRQDILDFARFLKSMGDIQASNNYISYLNRREQEERERIEAKQKLIQEENLRRERALQEKAELERLAKLQKQEEEQRIARQKQEEFKKLQQEKIRQEQLRQEQLKQEQLKQERLKKEAELKKQEEIRRAELIKEQQKKEQAERLKKAQEEANAEKERIQQEKLRQERLKKEAELKKQEQIRQERLRKEQIRQEQIKQEALKKQEEEQKRIEAEKQRQAELKRIQDEEKAKKELQLKKEKEEKLQEKLRQEQLKREKLQKEAELKKQAELEKKKAEEIKKQKEYEEKTIVQERQKAQKKDINKYNQLDAEIKKYMATEPKDAKTYIAIANTYKMLEMPTSAIKYYKEAQKLDAANSDIYYNLGLTYMELNSFVTSKANLTKAINLDKDNTKAKNLLGFVNQKLITQILNNSYAKYEAKDYISAFEILDNGIKEYPKHGQLYYYRALVYDKMNRNAAQIIDLQKAIELDPGYYMAYYQLGLAYEKINDEKSALVAYEKFLSTEPEEKDLVEEVQKKVITLGAKYY